MSDENPIIATNRDGEQVAQSLNDIFQTVELGNDLIPDQIQDFSGKLLQSYQPRIRNAFSKALKLESETD